MPDHWLNALLGGGMIGLSASALLLFNGRVAGVSGIFYGVLKRVHGEFLWSLLFVVGLLGGGLIGASFVTEPFLISSGRSIWMTAVAGLLVGFGTRLGGGCTSGHGVCGMSRLSGRSLMATLVFMLTGILTVSLLAGSGDF
jgi:uncharacterized protein